MSKATDPLQITPQQIRRFIKGRGWNSLADVQADLDSMIGQSVDAMECETWESRGIRTSDLASDVAQELASLIRSYEEGFLILFPLEVRSWREGMGMSQPQAAEYLGVARSTWSRWEQLGIDDHFAGTAAYALAASVISKNPSLLAERTRTIPILLDLERAAGREPKSAIEAAVAISRWGGQGDYARLGLGSFGLYRLLKDAWDTLACPICSAMNPTDARFCSSCGSAIEAEVTKP